MREYQPIRREQHATRRWRPLSDYNFVAREFAAPLVLAELPKATMSFPVAFLARADDFFPVALLSMEPGRNVFVAPDGRWVGAYVPAVFRGYPFALAKGESGQQVLCVAAEALVSGDGPEGVAFFDAAGEPTKAVTSVLGFLNQMDKGNAATEQACACLRKYALIQPWQITLKSPAGEKPVSGLFRIDEAAMNVLPGEVLKEMQQTGALALAYCQLLSSQHLPVLGKLAEAQTKAVQALAARQAKAAANIAQGRELNLEFLNDETIRFDGI